jgi:hypothetical protein
MNKRRAVIGRQKADTHAKYYIYESHVRPLIFPTSSIHREILLMQGVANVYAGGDPEVFGRLANGVSMQLDAALKAAGIPDAEIAAKGAIIRSHLATLLVEPPMPIQDAIDLAEFFVDTTATFMRFKRGAGTVGGPTESAAITKHEGFKWVHRKHYYDEVFNPKGSK